MKPECGAPLDLSNVHTVAWSVIATYLALELLCGHLAEGMKCPDSLASLGGGGILQLTKGSLFEVSRQAIMVIKVHGLHALVGT